MQDLKVITAPMIFMESAMEAVRQWTCKPFLVNGQPVEVETQIVVNFSMQTGSQ